ncbi:MAG: hypothetical protein JWP57_1540 [Spirosoma sp.]|nr:hypothetical protein [Spirosoma sp.]
MNQPIYSPIASHKPRWYVGRNQKQVNQMLAKLLAEAQAEENIGFDTERIEPTGLSWQQKAVIVGAYAVWAFFFFKLFA